MKKPLALVVLLLACTPAHAQYTFEYGGRTIRIDPDRGTVSIPGVYDNSGRKRAKSENGKSENGKKAKTQEAKTDQQAVPAPAAVPPEQAVPPAAPPAAATTTEPSTTTAAVTPSDTPPPAPPAAPAPPVQQNDPPVGPVPAAPAPAPTVAAVAPTAQPLPKQPTAAPLSNSPIGIWMTEEKQGRVRIEQCGANLCGYAVDKKSNENGEQVLINMKPAKDKWSGRILDPNTGSTYDSTIALKGTDTLRVQGCAFGGMFCGGQTWSRMN